MSDTRFRIAGTDSKLALSYPEVVQVLSLSGRNLSNICYGAIALYLRCLGFVPESKEDIKELAIMLEILNKHNIKPWLSTPTGDMPTAIASQFDPLSEAPDINWGAGLEETLF